MRPPGLSLKITVHPCDGLHEGVALHQLVDVEGVEAGNVKSCKPHVPDDDDPQGIPGFFIRSESVRRLSLFVRWYRGITRLSGSSGSNSSLVRRGRGHDDLDGPFLQVLTVPGGP